MIEFCEPLPMTFDVAEVKLLREDDGSFGWLEASVNASFVVGTEADRPDLVSWIRFTVKMSYAGCEDDNLETLHEKAKEGALSLAKALTAR